MIRSLVQYGGEASPPIGEVSQTAGEASPPIGESSQTAGEASQASGEVLQTAGEASQAGGEVSQTAGEASQASGQSYLLRVCSLNCVNPAPAYKKGQHLTKDVAPTNCLYKLFKFFQSHPNRF